MTGEESMLEKSNLKTNFSLVFTAHCLRNLVYNLEKARQISIFSLVLCTNTNNYNSDSLIFKLNYTALS